MANIPLSYNLRNLMVRKTTTVMTALGIGLTVAVLMGIGALVDGLTGALAVTGHPRNLILMRQGATSELVSAMPKEKFDIVKFMPWIEKSGGEPMVSHEVVSVTNLALRGDPLSVSNVTVRGMSPMGRELRGEVRLIAGRWFEPGKREVVVGSGVHAIRAGTSIGGAVPYGRGDWQVVGIFDAGRSAFNSEIWCDGNLAVADLGRGSTRSVALVRAEDETAVQRLEGTVADDQRLVLEAKPERAYYEEQMVSAAPVRGLGIFVAAIMAIGSCFAAMNTMYTAVARRSREIGILQMLGFSRGGILLSFLIESQMLAFCGAVMGLLLVLPLNGLESRIGNFVTFSETAFQFSLTPANVAVGFAFAAVMGVLGGLLPARQAASREILTSMRDL